MEKFEINGLTIRTSGKSVIIESSDGTLISLTQSVLGGMVGSFGRIAVGVGAQKAIVRKDDNGNVIGFRVAPTNSDLYRFTE